MGSRSQSDRGCRPGLSPLRSSQKRLPSPFFGGMTLIELLVVLTILSLLSVVAVVSTESVVGQGRFEVTQHTLHHIEEAVLGSDRLRSEDGTLSVTGFVADVGRLPIAVPNEDGELELAELWTNAANVPGFELKECRVDQDETIRLLCGWRGPYLRLPVGGAGLKDGWGNRLLLFNTDGNPAAEGDEVAAVMSLGSDGMEGEDPRDPYSRDLSVVFHDRYRTSIAFSVVQQGKDGLELPTNTNDQDAELVVRLFDVEDGQVDADAREPEPIGELTQWDWEHPAVVKFPNVVIGPKIARAYVESAGVSSRKSPPLEIHVHPQGPASWQLILPEDPGSQAEAGANTAPTPNSSDSLGIAPE